MAASMDLRWFNYTGAQRFLGAAVAAGLLASRDGVLRPAFDVTQVDVPLHYKPSVDLLTAVPPPGEDLFQELLEAIVASGALDARAAIARVNEKEERQDVEIEVAALLVLAEVGGDVRAFAPRVQDRLLRRGGPGDLAGAGR